MCHIVTVDTTGFKSGKGLLQNLNKAKDLTFPGVLSATEGPSTARPSASKVLIAIQSSLRITLSLYLICALFI